MATTSATDFDVFCPLCGAVDHTNERHMGNDIQCVTPNAADVFRSDEKTVLRSNVARPRVPPGLPSRQLLKRRAPKAPGEAAYSFPVEGYFRHGGVLRFRGGSLLDIPLAKLDTAAGYRPVCSDRARRTRACCPGKGTRPDKFPANFTEEVKAPADDQFPTQYSQKVKAVDPANSPRISRKKSSPHQQAQASGQPPRKRLMRNRRKDRIWRGRTLARILLYPSEVRFRSWTALMPMLCGYLRSTNATPWHCSAEMRPTVG